MYICSNTVFVAAKYLYASQTGSGSACSEAAPDSLGSVKSKVLTMNGNMSGDIVVSLRGETHFLTSPFTLGASDLGTNGYFIINQAHPGAAPTPIAPQLDYYYNGTELILPGVDKTNPFIYYSISCEIFFPEPYSYATILCRATEIHQSYKLPEAYLLKLQSSGKWELMAGSKILASGLIALNENSWHSILLDTKEDKIKTIINGQVVADITDSNYTHGMAGLGSSFHLVDFDNFEVE